MYDIFWYTDNFEQVKQQAITNSRTEYAWILCEAVDYTNFNLRYVPTKHEQTQCHIWGSHNNANTHTTWLIPVNHINSVVANYHSEVLPSKYIVEGWEWFKDDRINYANFNFDWLPDSWDWDKNHAWAMRGTTQLAYTYLKRKDATETIYHQSELLFLPNDEWHWITDDRIDYTNFNFNWLPDVWDKTLEHRFAMYGCDKLSYTSLVNTTCETTGVKHHTSTLMFKEPIMKIAKEELTATDLPEWVWIVDDRIDYIDFDFNWLPDEWDVNKTHCFTMKGCTELYYTSLINTQNISIANKFHIAELTFKPNATTDEWVWETDERIDYTGFDFTWLPDAWDINKTHCFTLAGLEQLSYTKLYNKRHNTGECKYHPSTLRFKPNASTDEWIWETDDRIDYSNFDFNWLPDAWDLDKEHCFAMKGCEKLSYTRLYNSKHEQTSSKYHPTNLIFKSNAAKDEWIWHTDDRIDYSNFDFNWLPDAWDIDKVHCFTMKGCEKLSYTRLYNSKHTQTSSKFHESVLVFKPQAAANEWIWHTDNRIDYTDFDFNWLPDAWDIDKVHCFTMAGCNHLHYTWLVNVNHQNSTFQKIHKANLKFKPNAANDEWVWVTDPRIDYSNFDFSWLPDTWDINKEHNFCMRYTDQLSYTKLYNSKHVTQGKTYHSSKLTFIDGAADDEWVWVIDPRIDYSEFDFDWLPNGWDMDKEHCFTMTGCEKLHYTKLYNKKHNKGTKKYHHAGLTFIEGAATDEWVWDIDPRIDYSQFDFTWLPDEWDMNKTHYFCMEDKKQLSYTKLRNIKVESVKDIFHESHLNFKEEPRTIFWPDYITHEQQYEWLCSQYFEDEWVWICDSRINYDNLNKRWLPDAWDVDKIHCMTMRNQKQLSYTWLVNTKTLQNKDFKYYKSSLKFEKSIQDKVYWPNFVTEILSGFDWQDSLANWVIAQELENEWVWIIDSRVDYDEFDFTWLPDSWDNQFIHCFAMKDKEKLSYTWLVNTKTMIQKKFKYHTSELLFNEKINDLIFLDMGSGNTSGLTADKKIRFTGNMESVVRSAVKRSTSEYVWICSTCSDYSNFKFDWLPDLDRLDFAHCWPALYQIKGETFFIHVPTFLRTNEFKWDFDHPAVARYPWPMVSYNEDNLADAINKNTRSSALYTVYHKEYIEVTTIPTPCLWEDRPVVGMSACNSVSLVPRDCIVSKEIYEYPFLERKIVADNCKMDVIFLYNGEKNSQEIYDRLSHRSYVMPKIVRGITPRLKAYQAAAEQSTTDWFLAVFAKCWMTDNFVQFEWRPDYWQQAKHYIFHNHNKDLDLTYGHMAPIAYNKRLMLENTGGLDMTLAQEHAVVPLVISETTLTDPWDTWRTAFRETAKLLYYQKESNNLELEFRLNKWLTAEQIWYKRGAEDAKNYFESTDGEYSWLMLTNEWDWLNKKFQSLYSADLTTLTI